MMESNQDPKNATMITRSFTDRESAERAYATLTARGYGSEDIHVIMSDETRKRYFSGDAPKSELGHKSLQGAGVGGAVGGAVGATTLAVLAAGAALTVPGLGLVIAGPLAGALAGGAAGAAAGGLLGLLVGAGIPEDRAKSYEKDLKQGGILLGVKPRHLDDARFFESEWSKTSEKVHL
jgi:hypothetical protein